VIAIVTDEAFLMTPDGDLSYLLTVEHLSEKLIAMADHKSLAAVTVLGMMYAGRAVPSLTALARDDLAPEQLRITAIISLGRIDTDQSLDVLVDELANPDPQWRIHVLEGLGWSRSNRASETLVQRLSDDDAYVQVIAAECINGMVENRSGDWMWLLDPLMQAYPHLIVEGQRQVMLALNNIAPDNPQVRALTSDFRSNW
jgi:HEAT repeat protein